MQAALGEGLRAALRTRNAAATNHVLHAYAAVGDPAGAEAAVRATLIAPAVARALEASRARGPATGTDTLSKVRLHRTPSTRTCLMMHAG